LGADPLNCYYPLSQNRSTFCARHNVEEPGVVWICFFRTWSSSSFLELVFVIVYEDGRFTYSSAELIWFLCAVTILCSFYGYGLSLMRSRSLRAAELDEPTVHSVYCGNLPFTADADELLQVVCRIATPQFCQIVRTNTGSSRGFGYACFTDGATARTAIERLNGIQFGGRTMQVRAGDLTTMFDWFAGTRFGHRIKGLIDMEQDLLRRPPALRGSLPLSPPPPPPMRESGASDRYLAEMMKRQIEVDAEQRFRVAMFHEMEEHKARTLERQWVERLHRLGPADFEVALAFVEQLEARKTAAIQGERWLEPELLLPRPHPPAPPRRHLFFEDDPA
jgi:hypothetical protein